MTTIQAILIGFAIGMSTMGMAWFLCEEFGFGKNTTIVIRKGEVVK